MSSAFDPAQGLIIVPVRLWGPTGGIIARLVLDTGATTTVVSHAMLELIGYDPDAITRRRPISMGGGVVFAPSVQLNRLVTLGQERLDFGVTSHTLPAEAEFDGVLGLDFLRGRRLLIDFRLGLVLLD